MRLGTTDDDDRMVDIKGSEGKRREERDLDVVAVVAWQQGEG